MAIFFRFFFYILFENNIFKPILNVNYVMKKQNVIEEPVVKRGRGRPRVTKQPKEPQKKRKAKNWNTTYDSQKKRRRKPQVKTEEPQEQQPKERPKSVS